MRRKRFIQLYVRSTTHRPEGHEPQARQRMVGKATAPGLGAWWHAGASHMPAAIDNWLLAAWGLRSRLDQLRAMQRPT
jgi:hypothetical protein